MFFVWNWTSWKKIISITLLIGLFFISAHFSSIYVFNTKGAEQAGSITKSLQGKSEIALTINVSWGDDVIIQILEVLKEKNIKATFFVNGEWALRNDDIAELIIEENHEVGLLGFYDEPYEGKPLEYISNDIKNGVETLKKLGYDPVIFVRPPENKFNQTVVDHIHSLGYRTVFWSLYANIQPNKETNQISNQIASNLSSGDIVLFLADDNITKTPEVIRDVIEIKTDEGYNFVSVTELLSPADIEIKPIE